MKKRLLSLPGPLFVLAGSAQCICGLRSRNSVRTNILLILIALASIGLSLAWLVWYWPVFV